jgi:hypothetical protein
MPLRKTLLIPVLLAFLCLPACEQPDDFTVQSSFRDPSTFVIVARGKPKAGETEELKRRYTAERAALLVAQHEMVVKLKDYRVLDQQVSETRFDDDQDCFLTYVVTVKK